MRAEKLFLEGVDVARKRDVLWDVFEHHFGPVANKIERGRRNAALKLVRESLESAGIDPASDEAVAELERRCQLAFAMWPDLTLTEVSIPSHWTKLGEATLR